MSPETLETRWLSLERWLNACVMPVALGVLGAVLLAMGAGVSGGALDIAAGVIGAVALGLLLFRWVDVFSARLMHERLMRDCEARYRLTLSHLSAEPTSLREAIELIDWLGEDLLT